jgi:hypothetical protein
VARWCFRTSARETRSSEEGGPRWAVAARTEELAAATHHLGQDGAVADEMHGMTPFMAALRG